MQLSALLERIAREKKADRATLSSLLSLDEKQGQELLFAAARKARTAHFQDSVFLYGFVYFSTWCRNNCLFCGWRKDNTAVARYRKSQEEISTLAAELKDAGVHLLDLTMGEDPYFVDADNFSALCQFISALKQTLRLPLMASFGVLSAEKLQQLKAAGTDMYACYQETFQQNIFQTIRPQQDFSRRLQAKQDALRLGMLIEEGLLTGTSTTQEDLAADIMVVQQSSAQQVRVMSFVPQKDTPLADTRQPDTRSELNSIAVMRLLMPDRLIPASLDVEGLAGLESRLMAGANVITSIIPADSGLKGVANQSLDIGKNARMPAACMDSIQQCGLRVAQHEEFSRTLASLRQERA